MENEHQPNVGDALQLTGRLTYSIAESLRDEWLMIYYYYYYNRLMALCPRLPV